MLAAVRYFCNRQLSDNSSLASFNKALKLIHDGGHTNEFDYDLNGMSLNDLTAKFRDIAKQSGAEDRMRSANRQFTGESEYTIVPITSFEESKRYGRYTSWCVTHGKDAYDSYTKGGEKFYFCLRNGFENVSENAGQNAPLDEYGLSMISVLVDCEGDLDRVTTRWNHDFGGENHPELSTTEQLEDLLNVNFYNTFVPYTKDELLEKGIIPFYAVSEMLAQGVPPEKIFSSIGKFYEDFAVVELNDKYNCINTNGELVSPNQWFDDCENFNEGFAVIRRDWKFNYINANGEILSPNKWFDDCGDFEDGFACVKLNRKWNYINANGELVSPKQWFGICFNFKEGFAKVQLNSKCNYINTNGEILSPMWFEDCGDFYEGFAVVELNDKCNYLKTNGEFLSPNKWFDLCWDFNEGFARVELNKKCNFINTNCDYLSDTWFDWCGDFNEGLAAVKLDGTWYEIDTKGQLYTENGEPINYSLQENRRYKKSKKHIVRITESQLRNAISKAIKKI